MPTRRFLAPRFHARHHQTILGARHTDVEAGGVDAGSNVRVIYGFSLDAVHGGGVGEVDVFGQINYLEVWNHERFLAKLQRDPFTDDDARALSDLGL